MVVAIIPALIVAVVLFLRQEAMREDVREVRALTGNNSSTENATRLRLDSVECAAHEASVSAHDLSLKMASVEESFIALSNKWNSREREFRNAARREEKERAAAEEQAVPDAAVPEEELLAGDNRAFFNQIGKYQDAGMRLAVGPGSGDITSPEKKVRIRKFGTI